MIQISIKSRSVFIDFPIILDSGTEINIILNIIILFTKFIFIFNKIIILIKIKNNFNKFLKYINNIKT